MRRHFAFFGPTTCVSLFETLGLAPGGHEPGCWRYAPPSETSAR
jgi:3-methyladenine DNA glycosylase Tag